MIAHRLMIPAAVLLSLLLSGCFGPSSTPQPTPSPIPTPTGSLLASPTMAQSPAATPTTAPPKTAGATTAATPSPTPGDAFVAYTVRPGDTLGAIARRFDTTWQSVLYWNRDSYPSLDPASSTYDPHRIQVGWTLQIEPGVTVAYDPPLPTPKPTAKPTVGPTPKPTIGPTPTAATGVLVTNGNRGINRVALTLDMGGRVGDALGIMTWLRDHDVRATIFMTGAMADSTATDAGRQVLALIDARPDLFDLGNHSYHHPHMTKLTVTQMRAELTTTEAAIARYASSSPRPFFRPPFGEWNTTLVNAAASVGYPYTVMWDVDTIDWKPVADGGPTAQQIVDKVVGRAQGGSIVLMHLGGYETLDALPGIVSGLRARGFELVTLGQMLGG